MTGAVVVSGGRSSLNPPLQTLLSPEPPTPNTLVKLKDLPVILQERWALSNLRPLPKLHTLPRMPSPTLTACQVPTLPLRLSSCHLLSMLLALPSSCPGLNCSPSATAPMSGFLWPTPIFSRKGRILGTRPIWLHSPLYFQGSMPQGNFLLNLSCLISWSWYHVAIESWNTASPNWDGC